MNPSSSSSLVLHNNKRKRDEDYSCKRPKHDVFLSYCNEDIGKSFVSYLKGSLHRNGFNMSDNTSLPAGQDESSELLKAIEESWIYVVVFSTKYPFSVKCLDELVLISKFEKKTIYPIFYKVDPSHVKDQQDASFLEAFEAHRKNNVDGERVEKWRHALQDVGNRAGEHLQPSDNEEESVRKIVKILGKLKLPLELSDAEHPVGIEPRAKRLITELNLDDPHPSITAVIGMSGSGKTTLVKAVFDTIAPHFDASCFIENIRYYKQYYGPNWKADLQQRIISRFTGNDYQNHSNIRNIVSRGKFLLAADDVDKDEQLEALGVEHHASFGRGSRILVMTTNKQSLSGLHKYTSYEISLLNISESFQLFVRHAYGKDEPVDKEFVDEIVYRAGGVPLVLKVWGLHFKSHERKQWPTLLERLRRIPHEKVQKKLQESYDSLTSLRAKDLFLDIACFFDGWKKDEVIKVLEDEDNAFFPDIEIQDLIDRGLVQQGDDGHLRMHEVIREMGREVVRQENEDDPRQRSRLVGPKDVVCVLRDCSGTDSVRSIYLFLDQLDEVVTVQVETLRKMSNLRFIRLLNYHLQWSDSFSNDDDIKSPLCFKHLKYLEWLGFPFRCLDNFEMGNVVVIKLQNSKLETLWEGALKSLKKLRILDVSGSRYLIWTGSFIGLENLEELHLDRCSKLEELDTSIGCLEKLVTLNLRGCKQLKRVPWEMIGKLTSLVTLYLNECPNIWNISHQLGNLKSLQELDIRDNSFSSLPDSLCQLHQLEEIELYSCDNLKSIPNLPPNIQRFEARDCSSLESLPSNMYELLYLTHLVLDECIKLGSEEFVKVTGLRNLEVLSMINCNVSQVCSEIGNMVSLELLYLSGNTFTSLPDSISNLSQLKCLDIDDCHKLKLLPLLPSRLSHIQADGCDSLDVMPFDSIQKGYIFRSKWCRNLQLVNSQEEDHPSFNKGIIIDLSREEEEEEEEEEEDDKYSQWCRHLHLLNHKLPDLSELTICLSGEEEDAIPEWCSYKSMSGEELCFVAPDKKKICGVIFYGRADFDSSITMLNKTNGTSHEFFREGEFDEIPMCVTIYPLSDETFVVESGDTLVIQYHDSIGLSFIYEDDVVDDSAFVLKKDINAIAQSDSPTAGINDEVWILPTPIVMFS